MESSTGAFSSGYINEPTIFDEHETVYKYQLGHESEHEHEHELEHKYEDRYGSLRIMSLGTGMEVGSRG